MILAFAERHPDAILVCYDFSRGMLRKAQKKSVATQAVFIEGDAAELPFSDDSFDIVTCSHSLYELKVRDRESALLETRRVVHPDGLILLMEHEVPSNPLVKPLFYLRLLSMGSDDARDFLAGGLQNLRKIFSRVAVSHSRSGKSRLMVCQK